MTVRLYDSKAQALRDFVPLREGRVGMYVCGPTVQSSPHIGHLRSALVYDIMRRWFSYRGYDVTFVRNVTDIDDKILAASAEERETSTEEWWALAYRVELEFTAAYASLGILAPTYEPRATASVQQMQQLIARLIERGHAYAAPDASGDVYFDTGELAVVRRAHPPVPRQHGGRGRRRPARQARPPRLRALEGPQARGARVGGLGVAVGRRAARLAHRVLGHGDALPRRGVRHPRRRARPALPAPRERARPVDRGRRRASRATGCTTGS